MAECVCGCGRYVESFGRVCRWCNKKTVNKSRLSMEKKMTHIVNARDAIAINFASSGANNEEDDYSENALA